MIPRCTPKKRNPDASAAAALTSHGGLSRTNDPATRKEMEKEEGKPAAATTRVATTNNCGTVGAPPVFHRLEYADGVAVSFPDPTPYDDGPVLDRRRQDFDATRRAARQWDHRRRVRQIAKEMAPDFAGTVMTQEDLVELMYGDIAEFGEVMQGPLEQGAYVVYVPF